MIDPRPAVIRRRLSAVGRVLAFSSAKGGVGKTVCAASSALALAERGLRVGLLDLDFQGSSSHLLLGADPVFPAEEAGLLPAEAAGLRFMSFALFSGEHPAPLRGAEVTDALLELLAVTLWGELDALVLDLPPGIGDEILDLLRYMEKTEFLVVSTPSRLSVGVVERLLHLLVRQRVPVLGLIENMGRTEEPPPASGSSSPAGDGAVQALAAGFRLPFLGTVPYQADLEAAFGRPEVLRAGPVGRSLGRILAGVL